MTEHRTFHNVEIRATGDMGPNGRPLVELQLIKPGVVDDYGSIWMPDVFDKRVMGRIAADPNDTPSLCWAHDWTDPIGHGIAYTPGAGGPKMTFELDDFAAVPRAKQADAQVRSKTIRDCSVGFSDVQRRDLTDDEKAKWPNGMEVIEQSDLDETSLVLRGAVPGAKVLSGRGVRTAAGTVGMDDLVDIAKRKAAGELNDAEAQVLLDMLAITPPANAGKGSEAPSPPSEPDPALDAAETMEIPDL